VSHTRDPLKGSSYHPIGNGQAVCGDWTRWVLGLQSSPCNPVKKQRGALRFEEHLSGAAHKGMARGQVWLNGRPL